MQTEKAKSSHFDRTRGLKNQIFPTLVCMGNSMACVARTEEKGRTDDAQPQICCNHRNKTVVTNNSGLRINLSKGKHANTYRYVGLNLRYSTRDYWLQKSNIEYQIFIIWISLVL